jgi:hypothetical protein
MHEYLAPYPVKNTIRGIPRHRIGPFVVSAPEGSPAIQVHWEYEPNHWRLIMTRGEHQAPIESIEQLKQWLLTAVVAEANKQQSLKQSFKDRAARGNAEQREWFGNQIERCRRVQAECHLMQKQIQEIV